MAPGPGNEPDVFERQLESTTKVKKKKGKIGKAIGLTCLGLLAAGTAYVSFFKSGRDTMETIRELPAVLPVVQNPELLFDNVGHNIVNVLVVGEDYNYKNAKVFNPRTGKYAPFHVIDKDSPPRSDTMILLSLNRETGSLRIVSMPRDARITYTDLDGDNHRARKLNSVYATGGRDPENRRKILTQVIGEELGIRVDRTVVIKPNSFKKLVDMVGGVEVNVDGALKLDRKTGKLYRGHIYYKDSWANWEVDLDPGEQTLNGEQAHGYVRFRKDREGDPGRIRRQQDVMKALAKKVMSMPKLSLIGVAKEIKTTFASDMTDAELGSLAIFAKDHGIAGKIQPLTLFGIYADNGDIILNSTKNEKLLPVIFGNSFNPEHFLVRSPSSRRDDLGPANNASPAVQALLKQAGLLDDETIKKEASSVREVEVRSDESAPRDSSSRRRRIASAEDETSSEPEPSETRKRRRSRERRTEERRREASPTPEAHTPVRTEESPVPQAEHPEPSHEAPAPEAPAAPESPVPQAEN